MGKRSRTEEETEPTLLDDKGKAWGQKGLRAWGQPVTTFFGNVRIL